MATAVSLLSDRFLQQRRAFLIRRGRLHGTTLTIAARVTSLIPLAIGAPLVSNTNVAAAGAALIYIAMTLCFGVATANFVAVMPLGLRFRMVALYLLLGNLIGLELGPPAEGLLLDHGLEDPTRVGAALALVGVASVALGDLLLCVALRPYTRLIRALPEVRPPARCVIDQLTR